MTESTFENILKDDGVLVYKTKGVSMRPMLKQDRDIIIIRPKPEGRLQKYDVPLYKRGQNYVLHRIIAVRENDYAILGDNTYQVEYGITDENIIGVLSEFVRKGKKHKVTDTGYKIYSRFWCAIYPLRSFYRRIKSLLFHIAGRILRLLHLRK